MQRPDMDLRFDLLLVNRRRSLQVLGCVLLSLLGSAWLLAQLAPGSRLSLAPGLLAGLACLVGYRQLRRRAVEPAVIRLRAAELEIQCGSGAPLRLPLADVRQSRYVAARGAHTLLLRTPAGRLRLATSELLTDVAQGRCFAAMAQAVQQALVPSRCRR